MSNPLRQYTKIYNSIFEYRFDSLNSFLNYIETMPTNRKVFYGSLSSYTGSYNFTKTNSLKDAIELCRNGCDEGFDKFLKLKNEVSESLIKSINKSCIYKDVVGYAPSVADFLAGSPFNMWNKSVVPSNNVIDIYFQLAYDSGTRISQIYNRGAITLSLIDALEKSGYAVNLYAIDFTYVSGNPKDEYLLTFFKLKDCSQYLNEKIVFFPLCHPSFERRCILRLTEVTPFILSNWSMGYGIPVSSIDTIKNYIHASENSIIISTPQKLNILGYSIHEDLSSMLEKLDLQKYFKRI